jgi:hypothetical protein
MQPLRFDTLTIVRMGPAMDKDDAVTPETGLDIASADQAAFLKATGGVVDISGNTWAAITNCDAYFNLTLTAANLDTLGPCKAVVQDASLCLPLPAFNGFVLPQNVFDSMASTDKLEVDMVEIMGVTALNLKNGLASMDPFTATGGTTTTAVTNLTQTNANQYKDKRIYVLSGVNIKASKLITGSAGTDPVTLTFAALPAAIVSGVTGFVA